MPGKWELDVGREDADEDVAVGLRRVDEDGLREAELLRERLQQLLGDAARVGEDGELVALERRRCKDVGDGVAEAFHADNLLCREAAVGHQRRARDERGRVGAEPDDRLGDLVGLAEPPHRMEAG